MDENVKIDFQHMQVAEALLLIAKMMKINIIVSPMVTGSVTLHLQAMSASDVFRLILVSHDLSAVRQQNSVWIVPRHFC